MSRRYSYKHLPQANSGIFTIITKEKEIQNDRERIIRTFKFNPNKTIEVNMTEPNKKISKPPHNISNTRNKNSNQSENQNIQNKNNNLQIISKDITRKTNPSSQFNTILSDDTEKETKSRLMIIKDKIGVENIYESESFNDINNDNDNDTENDEAKINDHNFNVGIKYLPVSNSSSDYSGNNSSKKESVLIRKYDQEKIKFLGLNQAKARKIKQLFFFHPSYDISNRLLNDEVTSYPNNRDDNKQFKFIKEVQQDNDKLQKINLISFVKLSDCAIYNFLTFCYDNFDNLALNYNKLISSKINLSLNNIFDSVITLFKAKYKHIIRLEEFYFKQKTFKNLKRSYPILDLVLKVKVITKTINKSYEIGYSYLIDKVIYNNKWKFDIKSKGNSKIWFASELDLQQQNIKRFCYTHPVAVFCFNDIIELRMNLFSKKSILNPFSINWEDIVITDSPKGFYEKTILRCPYAFNNLYSCEIENMIHLWNRVQSPMTESVLLSNFKRFFSKYFSIDEIVYNEAKMLFYKIRLTAISEGRIKKNQYINFDIEIISKHKQLKNEIQSLGLLNSTLLSECIQIRKGTLVVFYLTEFLPESIV